MVRNIFRTAAIGMVAVAGLFMLFFVLRMLLFFFIAGFIASAIYRRWAARQAEFYGQGWAPATIGDDTAAPNERRPFAAPAAAPAAIVEIYR